MATATYQLPAELLLECLRAADPPTRVRASHVSRRWRAVALGDRRLWDSFVCTKFRDELDQDAMFDKLQAMLLRSSPLPFQLCIPHRYCGGASDYENRLKALNQFDTRRLSLYGGPTVIFSHMNTHGVPLPLLTALDVRDNRSSVFPWTIIILDGDFSGHMLPNLQILSAHYISLSLNSAPFPSLRDLTCSAGFAFDYEKLFKLCPNLSHVRFNDLAVSEPLPSLSLPLSLQSMELKPARLSTFDIPRLLRNITLSRLPRLVLRDAGSLQGVMPLFISVHPRHNVELRLHSSDHALTLSAIPDDDSSPCAWTIVPSPPRPGFLSSFELHTCERLTSLSVPMAQLGRLFDAQLHFPGLARLEFRLHGTQDEPALPSGDDEAALHAPRLQHITFSADAARADLVEIQLLFVALRASFRKLIVYDADLLHSIEVSSPAACVRAMNCADLARFAEMYTVCETA